MKHDVSDAEKIRRRAAKLGYEHLDRDARVALKRELAAYFDTIPETVTSALRRQPKIGRPTPPVELTLAAAKRWRAEQTGRGNWREAMEYIDFLIGEVESKP